MYRRATSEAILIFGRANLGMPSDDITITLDNIISNTIPLRERGIYIAIVRTIDFSGIALVRYMGGVFLT